MLKNIFLYISGIRRLAVLDLLLAAESEGLIDSEGVKEEVNTLIAAVSNFL